jgi:bifunctional DNase/RNase
VFRQVKFLTTVKEGYRETHYFLYKEGKIVVPVTTWQNHTANNYLLEPPTYDTFNRTISCLGGKITSVKIYLFLAGTFYSYLVLEQNATRYEINSSFQDALAIARETLAEYYINEEIIYEQGIRVTKDLIERSLSSPIDTFEY